MDLRPHRHLGSHLCGVSISSTLAVYTKMTDRQVVGLTTRRPSLLGLRRMVRLSCHMSLRSRYRRLDWIWVESLCEDVVSSAKGEDQEYCTDSSM